MAIGTFYDHNRDMMFDSKAQYDRHMEHLRYEQQRMMHAQQQRDYNPYGGAIAGGHHAEQQRQVAVVDPKDPLAFLKKADNKLLLTGEAP
jgi:hypothetical protein